MREVLANQNREIMREVLANQKWRIILMNNNSNYYCDFAHTIHCVVNAQVEVSTGFM